MSKGYKDSYPISNEEYNKHILNGAPFTCPKCDKPCKRQLSFDYHLASKCMGIKMIWPKWEKVQKDKFMCLLPNCPEAGKILGKFERDYFAQLFKTDKCQIKQLFLQFHKIVWNGFHRQDCPKNIVKYIAINIEQVTKSQNVSSFWSLSLN